MNNYQLEQLENIRRTADRGMQQVLDGEFRSPINSFQHILDLVESIKRQEETIYVDTVDR